MQDTAGVTQELAELVQALHTGAVAPAGQLEVLVCVMEPVCPEGQLSVCVCAANGVQVTEAAGVHDANVYDPESCPLVQVRVCAAALQALCDAALAVW